MVKPKTHAYGTKSCEMVFLERGFVKSKMYPCLFMSNTVICVVYVDDYLFWERSQSDIDNVMKSFKEDGPSYNWEHSPEYSCLRP